MWRLIVQMPYSHRLIVAVLFYQFHSPCFFANESQSQCFESYFPRKNEKFPALTDPTRDPLTVVELEEFRNRSRLN